MWLCPIVELLHSVCPLVPHITVFDVTVQENVGTVIVQFERTGGDLSFGTRILASTAQTDGMLACESKPRQANTFFQTINLQHTNKR